MTPLRGPVVSTWFAMSPTATPRPMPISEPSRPITTASMVNRPKIFPPVMPRAFMRPISRVRSCTAMSRVLMMPKLAASSAMSAKPVSTHVTASMMPRITPSCSSRVCASRPWSASACFTASSFASGSATIAVAWK